MREFGDAALNAFDSLLKGVTVDAISVKPEMLEFGQETVIELHSNEENHLSEVCENG